MTSQPTRQNMEEYPIHLTKLILENISAVMSFAYSRRPLDELMQNNFAGEWDYLRKALFDIAEQRANRAITELAVLLRILDDEQKRPFSTISPAVPMALGRLELKNGEVKELSLRELSNKIIHAQTFSWDYSECESPGLNCYSRDDDNRSKNPWKMARVNLLGLACFCGGLMS